MSTCTCQHIALTHRYVTATRGNVGACLALGCGCRGFHERAENPLEIRGNQRAAWDNRGTNQDGPGRRANAVIPGPRRSNEEID